MVTAVLAFAGLGASFMQTVLVPIQADLPRFFDAPPEQTSWLITVTLLSAALAAPIGGRLGDLYGRRRIALTLIGLLVVSSVVCALSSWLPLSLVGRAVQGLSMAVIPLGMSILRDAVPARRLGVSIAVVSATLGAGGAIGLPLSALVALHFDWHALFWMTAVLGASAFVLCAIVLPRSARTSRVPFDVVGAGGLTIALAAILVPLSQGGRWGWTSPQVLLPLTVGVVMLVGWVRFEWTRAAPLVNVRLFSSRQVMVTNLASIAIGVAFFASNIVYPQLLRLPPAEGGAGLDAVQASLVLMPSGLAMLAVSPFSGRLIGTIGPKRLLLLGAALVACAYALPLAAPSSVSLVVISTTAIGIGIGFAFSAIPTLVMSAVPLGETGSANGVNTLMRALGTSVASAVITAVLTISPTVSASAAPSAGAFRVALVFATCSALAAFAVTTALPRSARPPRADTRLGR